jgi:hypothetical protein
MLPPVPVLDLPATARAAVDASRTSFVTTNRGQVRINNDSTLGSRARHFANWLDAQDFTIDSLAALNPSIFPSILAAYVTAVADGNNCQMHTNLTDQSLRGYLSAASDAITMLTPHTCSYLDPSTIAQKRPKTLPTISQIIHQRAAWSAPLPRKEPFTLDMIDALRTCLASCTL